MTVQPDTNTLAEPIRDHIRGMRGMAEYADDHQIVCSDAAMLSWADALEEATDALVARCEEAEQDRDEAYRTFSTGLGHDSAIYLPSEKWVERWKLGYDELRERCDGYLDRAERAERREKQLEDALGGIAQRCQWQGSAEWMHLHELAMSDPFKCESEVQRFVFEIAEVALAASGPDTPAVMDG